MNWNRRRGRCHLGVELREDHAGDARPLLLVVQESVEPSDDIGALRTHRPTLVQDHVDEDWFDRYGDLLLGFSPFVSFRGRNLAN